MLYDQHTEESWPGIFQMSCLRATRMPLQLVQGPLNFSTPIALFSMLTFLFVCIACSQNHEPHPAQRRKCRHPLMGLLSLCSLLCCRIALPVTCRWQCWVLVPTRIGSCSLAKPTPRAVRKSTRKPIQSYPLYLRTQILNLSALVLFVQRMFFWGHYFSAKCSVKIFLSSHSFSLFLSSLCFFLYV